MTVQTISILEKSYLTQGILRLRLGADKPIEFNAGQYILLGLDSEELKPFSIAMAPDGSGHLECHIRKNLHSSWMQSLFAKEQGGTLYWQGPINHLTLADKAMPTIFVAGGTGFALIKALLEQLLKTKPVEPIYLYWGVRQSDELYHHNWLAKLCQQHKNIHYIPVISELSPDWKGATGRVHEKVLQDIPNIKDHIVYLCGPMGLQQEAKQAFVDAGLKATHFIA